MSPALRFFSQKETQVLKALLESMIETDAVDGERNEDADALATMDSYVAGLPSGLQAQLRRALRLFQCCPILFIGRPRTFTRLSRQDQEAYIRTWAESRLGLRRRVFRALRDLAFVGYYSQPGARELIGHSDVQA